MPECACIFANRLQVWAKMDALQPSGSFKLRGIGHMTSQLSQQGAKRFVSSSGGNAGIAVACVHLCCTSVLTLYWLIFTCSYCGRKLGVPVTVVVPSTASARAGDAKRTAVTLHARKECDAAMQLHSFAGRELR